MTATAAFAPVGGPDLDRMTFQHPWTARLFGVTVALSEAGLFTMADFQSALIAATAVHEKAGCISDETDYYTQWLTALTALLGTRGVDLGMALSSAEDRVARRLRGLRHERHHRRASTVRGQPTPLVVA